MVRGKPLDSNIKQLILTEYRNMGKPYQKISSNLGVARSTVHNVIKKFEKHTEIDEKPKYGCPRKTNLSDDLSLQRVVTLNPYDSLAEIKKKWETVIQKSVSMTTCRRRLHELGIRLPARPPFQNIREPEINIIAVDDVKNIPHQHLHQQQHQQHLQLQQFPENSLLEEQSFDTESMIPENPTSFRYANNNNNNNYQDHKHQKHKKTKKSPSNKRRMSNSSKLTMQATLNSLQTVTKAISTQHDEFSLFGEYMAMSLRTMPIKNALKCKEKLLSVIVNERLNVGIDNA